MKIITITGSKNSGKTLLLKNLIQRFQSQFISCDGIISLPILVDNEKIGFDILRLSQNTTLPLCRKNINSLVKTEYYSFYEETFDIGKQIISELEINTKIMILDEIGVLESKNQGWYEFLNELLKLNDLILILTFRKNLYEKLIKKFEIKSDYKIDLDETEIMIAEELIIKELNGLLNCE